MKRRGFLAGLAALFVAPKLPAVEALPVEPAFFREWLTLAELRERFPVADIVGEDMADMIYDLMPVDTPFLTQSPQLELLPRERFEWTA